MLDLRLGAHHLTGQQWLQISTVDPKPSAASGTAVIQSAHRAGS
jgi:hypothetical protein